MFDYLKCDMPLPNGQRVEGFVFQTKSLYSSMLQITITAEGRLFLERCRYESTEEERELAPGVLFPDWRRVSLGDVDLNYHGDIEFHGGADEEFQRWAARFTNGALEWIRPFDELNETHRDVLMASD